MKINELYKTMRVVKVRKGIFAVEAVDSEKSKYRFFGHNGLHTQEGSTLWGQTELETREEAVLLLSKLKHRYERTKMLLKECRNAPHELSVLAAMSNIHMFLLEYDQFICEWMFCYELICDRIEELRLGGGKGGNDA
ncbi:MAG TPA: hypothetical protein VLH56_11745 [Dissulfurispiraceae bacterium]|nr:hypothetical protein [Dissulfurispiraceae bacterium]